MHLYPLVSVVLLLIVLLLSSSLLRAQNISLSAVSAPFPSRTSQACAYNMSQSPPSPSAALFVLGGYANFTRYADVWTSTSGSSSTATFTQISDAQYPVPATNGAGAALLLNGELLLFGGEEGLAINDVWLSQDGGVQWRQITHNAPWSSRSSFAYCVLPLTNVVVLVGGVVSSEAPGFNSSDVWINEDGEGLLWTQQSATPPFGAVSSSAVVGLYDHTLLMTGGLRNGSAISEVWLSYDIGETWTLQPALAAFGARAYHAMAVDGNDIVYVAGGSGVLVSDALDVWASNTKGASWTALTVSGSAVPSVLSACAFVRPSSGGATELILAGGNDVNGTVYGVIIGAISSALSAASSTAIALSGNATNTAQPALPPLPAPLNGSSSSSSSSSVSSAAAASSSGTAASTSSSSSTAVGNGNSASTLSPAYRGLAMAALLLTAAFLSDH